MFNLREYLMDGLIGAAKSKRYRDYEIILPSVRYYDRGILKEDDLAALQNLLYDDIKKGA